MHMIMKRQALANIQVNQKLKGRDWVVSAALSAAGVVAGAAGGAGGAAAAPVDLKARDAAGVADDADPAAQQDSGPEHVQADALQDDADAAIDPDADDEDVSIEHAHALFDMAAVLAREEPVDALVGVGADECGDDDAAKIFASAAIGGVTMEDEAAEDDTVHLTRDGDIMPAEDAERSLLRSLQEAIRVLGDGVSESARG